MCALLLLPVAFFTVYVAVLRMKTVSFVFNKFIPAAVSTCCFDPLSEIDAAMPDIDRHLVLI